MSNRAYSEGITANEKGYGPDRNPYTPGTELHADWLEGWNHEEELARAEEEKRSDWLNFILLVLVALMSTLVFLIYR